MFTEGDADPRQVLVTVDIDAVMGGTTVEVPIKARKLREGYSVSLSVPSVDVILTGPSVVLDELALDLVEAYVDLTGLEAGNHQIKVVVELRTSQNPQLADLTVMSVSPAFVEADIEGPAPGAPGTLPTLPPPDTSSPPAETEPPPVSGTAARPHRSRGRATRSPRRSPLRADRRAHPLTHSATSTGCPPPAEGGPCVVKVGTPCREN